MFLKIAHVLIKETGGNISKMCQRWFQWLVRL